MAGNKGTNKIYSGQEMPLIAHFSPKSGFETLYGGIFAAIPLPVFITDTDFFLLWMNGAAEEFISGSISENSIRPIAELFIPEDISYQEIKTTLKQSGNTPPYIEFKVSSFPQKIKVLALSISINDVVYYIFQFLESSGDIERSSALDPSYKNEIRLLKTEDAIEDQTEILNDLLSNMPGIVYRCSRVNDEWALEYISPGCRQITGYSAKNLISRRSLHFGRLIHPDDRQRVLAEIELAVQRNRKFRIEYRMVAHNKTIKWVSDYGRGQMNAANELIRIEGFITDITREKMYDTKLKEELRISQSLSQLGIDLLGETIDPDLFAREVQDNIMEYTGSPFSVLIVPSLEEDGMIYFLKSAKESEKIEFNSVSVTDKNIPFSDYLESGLEMLHNGQPIVLSLQALGIDDETFTRLAGVSIPINYSRHGYLLLAGAPADYTPETLDIVYRFVNIFSQGLYRIKAEKLLQLAKDKAEESDRMKSMFLSNMSHEIRTPMNAIVGFADMLHEVGLKREEKDKFLDAITRSGDSLLMLINDIIDISKIEAGQLKLVSSPCNVNELLDELETDFAGELARKNKSNISLYIQKEFPGPDFIIHTDAMRLRQVLSNLVGNAIKFTDEGFIEIGYRVQAGKLLFYVRDSGVGISKEDQAVIFKRFGQAESQQPRNFSGTGLGLTISKNIIGLLGGDIWVESIPDEGSTFWFTLPLVRMPARSKQSKVAKSAAPSLNLTGKSILVVEDVDTNYFYISTLLEKLKANVVRATNGLRAVEICAGNPEIDLVLMDVELPILNGYEATKKIKETRPDLPVIAQTAYAMAGERERSEEAGCDDYLAKPIRKDDLIDAISRLI